MSDDKNFAAWWTGASFDTMDPETIARRAWEAALTRTPSAEGTSTPRTDKAARRVNYMGEDGECDFEAVTADFSRQLERELYGAKVDEFRRRLDEEHAWAPDGDELRFESHPGCEAPHVHTTCKKCGARAWFTEQQWGLLSMGCSTPSHGGASESPPARVIELLRATVDLASEWDEHGAVGPKAPYTWETVARMAMDYARAALAVVPSATPSITDAARKALRRYIWQVQHPAAPIAGTSSLDAAMVELRDAFMAAGEPDFNDCSESLVK